MTRQYVRLFVIVALVAGLAPAIPVLRVQAQDNPAGAIANGASVHRRISVGTTEDETQIKATPGIVLSITATNTNAAARYLKCYNLTAANAAPGTSTPWLALAVPPAATSGALSVSFPSGAIFSVALTCSLVTGAADSDVAEVAASELMWFITYK
jgi:hypothetical protein